MKLEQKLVLKNDVINGFSFSFGLALVNALREMERNNEIIKQDDSHGRQPYFTDIAYVAMNHLSKQLEPGTTDLCILYPAAIKEDVANFLDTAEKFLAIFQEK